jgi:FkbM family methyltransferase
VAVSLYSTKYALLAPLTAWRRRREPDQSPMARSLLELHHYDRAMYAFMGATAENPDLLVDLDVEPDDVVLDVGAYDGHWTEQLLNCAPSTRVYAFEPNPQAFAKFERRLGRDENVTLLRYGLSGRDANVMLALEGPGSSVYTQDSQYGTAAVELRDIVAVLDELGLDEVAAIKVNIEGGEYDLLDRLIASRRIGKMRQVSVQFHEWHPNAYWRRWRIRHALRRTHEQVWNYPWVWELWRAK